MSPLDGFDEQEKEVLFRLAERLTGACHRGAQRKDILLSNVERRMARLGIDDLTSYLSRAATDTVEKGALVSALTIHTTSWFRERLHFEGILATTASGHGTLRILSAACSTGEEVYSLAMLLEAQRVAGGRDYEILGIDIDPVSVTTAKRAVYLKDTLDEFPVEAKPFAWTGKGPTERLFAVAPDVRSRCRFETGDLRNLQVLTERFEIVLCRNVLIYFPLEVIPSIITGLKGLLQPGGLLCLGHSEAHLARGLGLTARGRGFWALDSVARKGGKNAPSRATELCVLGASTGGTEALALMLRDMPKDCPPILVAQHIAPHFAEGFVRRLADISGLALGTCVSGEPLKRGHIYAARGDTHIGVRQSGGVLRFDVPPSEAKELYRPSVDKLFTSAVGLTDVSIFAALLTGMGRDGARGLAGLAAKGAITCAQDEASCAVFGMPKEAIALGAAGFVGPPNALRARLIASMEKKRAA